MTGKAWIHIVSSLVASAGAVLAIGDKITAIPSLPGYVVNAWPLVVFFSTIIDRVGSAIVDAQKEKE